MGRVAHQMAMQSSKVTADVVEVQEYPNLARAYAVRGVPKTVINNKVTFVGAVPEETFVEHLLSAVDTEAGQVEDEKVEGDSTPL